MKWSSAISDETNHKVATQEVLSALSARFGPEPPDLAILFASAHFSSSFEDVVALVRQAYPSTLLAGCSGAGIIGDAKEVEGRPAVSLTLARLPDVRLVSVHLRDVPDDPEALKSALSLPADADPSFVVLPDPFTSRVETLIEHLDAAFPRAIKVGGLASGGSFPGGNALFLGMPPEADRVHRAGAVILAMYGNVEVKTVIAQGCRPIGQPMLITRVEENVLYELQSQPALEVMKALYQSLGAKDQELFGQALFVGIEMKDQVEYQQGDFLVRNIVGLDPDEGTLSIGALPKQWQAMQFHVRDADASREDLDRMLDRCHPTAPKGALLFSCLGRGMDLYGEPDHDSRRFRARVEDVPVGGFFCNGEIGPVGGTTFLHGYTSAFAVFSPKVE